jgi:low affinity Fe/Cu permease
MAAREIRKGLTHVGVLSGHVGAFAILGAYAALWLIFDRKSLDFHGAATLFTWLMTLFIQRAEHRDTQALQAKLDELLRAQGDARSELTHLDKKPASEIEQHREDSRSGDKPG